MYRLYCENREWMRGLAFTSAPMLANYGKKNFRLEGIRLSQRSTSVINDALADAYLKEVKKDSKIYFKECRLPISYRLKERVYKKAQKSEVRYYLQTIIQIPKDPKPC